MGDVDRECPTCGYVQQHAATCAPQPPPTLEERARAFFASVLPIGAFAFSDKRHVGSLTALLTTVAAEARVRELEQPEMCQDMACGADGLYPVCRKHYEEPAKLRAENAKLRAVAEAARALYERVRWPHGGAPADESERLRAALAALDGGTVKP